MKTSIKFVATIESEKWAHFAWAVSINGETFNYKTGLGHGVPKTGKGKGVCQSLWESERPNKKPLGSIDAGDYWASVPAIDDVLECLFSDAQAGNESFDEFCDNYGYPNDSLSALDTYRACAEIVKKLKKALGSEYLTEKQRIENKLAG